MRCIISTRYCAHGINLSGVFLFKTLTARRFCKVYNYGQLFEFCLRALTECLSYDQYVWMIRYWIYKKLLNFGIMKSNLAFIFTFVPKACVYVLSSESIRLSNARFLWLFYNLSNKFPEHYSQRCFYALVTYVPRDKACTHPLILSCYLIFSNIDWLSVCLINFEITKILFCSPTTWCHW